MSFAAMFGKMQKVKANLCLCMQKSHFNTICFAYAAHKQHTAFAPTTFMHATELDFC